MDASRTAEKVCGTRCGTCVLWDMSHNENGMSHKMSHKFFNRISGLSTPSAGDISRSKVSHKLPNRISELSTHSAGNVSRSRMSHKNSFIFNVLGHGTCCKTPPIPPFRTYSLSFREREYVRKDRGGIGLQQKCLTTDVRQIGGEK